MKAIILAAGQGTRLRPYTDDRPKCMVELRGKPLLDHQLDVLKAAGLTDLHVIAGYIAERIERPGLSRHVNPAYARTNMVSTLFSAAHLLTGDEDVIVAYGDIVYELRVLRALMAKDAQIALGVDLDWRKFWEARMENPLADAETLKLADTDRIVELGKKPRGYDEIQGQYMGLIRIRADHVRKFVDAWEQLDRSRLYDGKDVDNMFMTSFLQHLIDRGWDVRAAFARNGWLEVDSPEDLSMDSTPFWNPHQV
jgi:choline kinase